jgi:hypothetical protein
MAKRGRPFGTFKNPARHDSAVYRRWSGMIQRCKNPKSHIWKYYGGRGITVCERWSGKDGFKNFYTDMGEPNGLTLDRKDGSRGYSPDNCRWATWKEQAANRRIGSKINPNSLMQRAKAAGLDYHLVVNRIRLGWSEIKALTTQKLPQGAQPGHRNYRS